MTILEILKKMRNTPHPEQLKEHLILTLNQLQHLDLSMPASDEQKGDDTNKERLSLTDLENLATCLKNNTSVVVLDITGNHIGLKGAEIIAEMLKFNKTIKSLYIQNNDLQSAGVYELGSGLEFNKTLLNLDAEQEKDMQPFSEMTQRHVLNFKRVLSIQREINQFRHKKLFKKGAWTEGNYACDKTIAYMAERLAFNRLRYAENELKKSRDMEDAIFHLSNQLSQDYIKREMKMGVLTGLGVAGIGAAAGIVGAPTVLLGAGMWGLIKGGKAALKDFHTFHNKTAEKMYAKIAAQEKEENDQAISLTIREEEELVLIEYPKGLDTSLPSVPGLRRSI